MAIRTSGLSGAARTARASRLTRIDPISPAAPIHPFQTALDEQYALQAAYDELPRRRPAAAPLPQHVRRAAAAAKAVVGEAIEVNQAADQVAASPSEDAMTELQHKADSLSRRLQGDEELQLDPGTRERLSAAYTPTDWREIVQPIAEQAPWRMIPIREAIYTDRMQLQSLYPDTGLVLSTEA